MGSKEREVAMNGENTKGAPQKTKIYARRWFMLAIFCAYSFSSAFQWIHLNIIGNILIKYYNASLPEDPSDKQLAIDWLSMLYMVTYIPLVFPATFLLNRKGLHFCSIVGSSMTAMGAWIKAAAVDPNSFPLLFIGQAVVATAQIFVLEVPPHLAAVWFGENEVSTATAIGVFGNQVGIAVGFLLPPFIVPDSEDLNEIGENLRILLLGTGTFSTIVFFIVLIFFRAAPPLPPTLATHAKTEEALHSPMDFLRSLKRLFSHKAFVLLTITYGINTGSFYAISTLLNPIILNYFPNEEQHAGQIGLTIVLAGVVGSVIAGIWLDRTKTYKLTTALTYVFSMLGMLSFTLFLHYVPIIWVAYIVAGVLGFFMTGYLPVGFEFAAELTYPEPEGTSSGMLNAASQVFGIAFTMGMSKLLTLVSCLVGNAVVTGTLCLGLIGTLLIKADLRRQKANKHLATIHSNLGAADPSLAQRAQNEILEANALLSSGGEAIDFNVGHHHPVEEIAVGPVSVSVPL